MIRLRWRARISGVEGHGEWHPVWVRKLLEAYVIILTNQDCVLWIEEKETSK